MRKLWVAFAILSIMMMIACTTKPATAQQVFSVDDVVQALRADGVEATAGTAVESAPFVVKGRMVTAGDAAMVVYVYASKADQERIQVTDGGYTVSNGSTSMHIDWTAPPHFIRKENILITFATANTELAAKVETALSQMKKGT